MTTCGFLECCSQFYLSYLKRDTLAINMIDFGVWKTLQQESLWDLGLFSLEKKATKDGEDVTDFLGKVIKKASRKLMDSRFSKK